VNTQGKGGKRKSQEEKACVVPRKKHAVDEKENKPAAFIGVITTN